MCFAMVFNIFVITYAYLRIEDIKLLSKYILLIVITYAYLRIEDDRNCRYVGNCKVITYAYLRIEDACAMPLTSNPFGYNLRISAD